MARYLILWEYLHPSPYVIQFSFVSKDLENTHRQNMMNFWISIPAGDILGHIWYFLWNTGTVMYYGIRCGYRCEKAKRTVVDRQIITSYVRWLHRRQRNPFSPMESINWRRDTNNEGVDTRLGLTASNSRNNNSTPRPLPHNNNMMKSQRWVEPPCALFPRKILTK